VPQGHIDNRLVANIDLAPTFARWAEIRTPRFIDGRSFIPILKNPDAPWRKRLLFEHRLADHSYNAIRTNKNQVYIEYPLTKETEYYDLARDPHQLDGKADKPPSELKAQLHKLTSCAGASCRAADGAIPGEAGSTFPGCHVGYTPGQKPT